MDARSRGRSYYAAAVLAGFGLLVRALWWGALGTLGLAFWLATKLADRYLGQWVAPSVPPSGWAPTGAERRRHG